MLIKMAVTGEEETVSAPGFLREWSDQCIGVQEPELVIKKKN